MLIIISTSLLAVVLSYLSGRTSRKNHLFEVGFIIITIVAAIRWDYACDYERYYVIFLADYHISDFWSLLISGFFKEPGWALLNYIFPETPLGFVMLTALISIFQNYVYYRFIKDNVCPHQRWFAMAIYLFSTSYWLMNMSMLRQGLTVTLFVFASKYISEKKLLPSFLIVLFACTVHKTAYILLPFLLLSFAPLKSGKWPTIILIGTFFVILFVKDILNDLVNIAFSFEQLEGYSHYIEDSDSASFGLGGMLNALPFIIMVYFLITRFDGFNKYFKLILILSLVRFCLLPLQISNGAFARITTYFAVFTIVTIPEIYSQIKDKSIRLILTAIFMFMLLFQYHEFLFTQDWSAVAWRNYHTFLDLL